jgi:hypothetical protein
VLVLFYGESPDPYFIVAGDKAFKQLVNFKSDAGEKIRKNLKGNKKVEAAVEDAEKGKKF